MKLKSTILISAMGLLAFACGPGTGADNTNKKNDTDTTMHDHAGMGHDDMHDDHKDTKGNIAVAQLSSKSGSNVTGTATFNDEGDGKVTFHLTIEGATPGKHAVHLHENGDCSAEDASSAGGHWSPEGHPHGKRPEGKYHAGDIDNIEVGKDGKGELSMKISGWTVGGDDRTNVVGHSVIVHAGEDDFTSQPSGDAGGRVACGVIEMRD